MTHLSSVYLGLKRTPKQMNLSHGLFVLKSQMHLETIDAWKGSFILSQWPLIGETKQAGYKWSNAIKLSKPLIALISGTRHCLACPMISSAPGMSTGSSASYPLILTALISHCSCQQIRYTILGKVSKAPINIVLDPIWSVYLWGNWVSLWIVLSIFRHQAMIYLVHSGGFTVMGFITLTCDFSFSMTCVEFYEWVIYSNCSVVYRA